MGADLSSELLPDGGEAASFSRAQVHVEEDTARLCTIEVLEDAGEMPPRPRPHLERREAPRVDLDDDDVRLDLVSERAHARLAHDTLERSEDAGASYEFILRYGGDSAKYPYIEHILFPSSDPALVIVGGFDKAAFGPFLAVSRDGGATWTDQSAILPGAGLEPWSVAFLEETPEGQVIIGVEDDQDGRLHVFELERESVPRRRRAVRR